ncbi:MAG: class I SAM-dependent methyltransferase [Myxococcota bacterium]
MSDEPYTDAVLYDLEYEHFDEDVSWYLGLAQQLAPRGPVIELGCGTGRLTLPLAKAGIFTTGLDRAGPMVDRLEAKLRGEPAAVQEALCVLREDYRAYAPPEPVPLVLWPFNALHHLDSEADLVSMLMRIRSWMGPHGTLALDAYLPDPTLYGTDPERRHEQRRFVDPRDGIELESWEQGWWDAENQTSHVLQVYRRPDGTETRVHLALRMFTRRALHQAISEAGWTLISEFSDYQGTPLADNALKWVAVLTT